MNLQGTHAPELIIRLGWALAHSLWEGGAAAGVLMAVLGIQRQRSPQARYLASLAALGLLILACAATFAWMPTPGESDTARNPAAAQSSPIDGSELPGPVLAIDPSGLSRGHAPLPSVAPPPRTGNAIDSPANPPRLIWLPTCLALAWMIGLLFLTIWRFGGWFALRRMRIARTFPVEAYISDMVVRLQRRMRISRPVVAVQSFLAQTPMIIGWLRPMILIPPAILAGLSLDQLEAILAHELAHIRRHDYLANLLQVLAETLLFYHPAVWWISRVIRLEREQQCDDIAVSVCKNRLEYIGALARIEEIRLGNDLVIAATGDGGAQLLKRIRRMLADQDNSSNWSLRTMLAIFVIAAFSLGLFNQAHSQSTVGPAAATNPAQADQQNNTTNETLKQYELQHDQDIAAMAELMRQRDQAIQQLANRQILPSRATTKPMGQYGKIANVASDNEVYIDLGSVEHVTVGMQFVVYAADQTFNPAARDTPKTKSFATIVVGRVFQNVSQCRISLVDAGQHIAFGDIVGSTALDGNPKPKYFVVGNFDLGNTGHPSAVDRDMVEASIVEHGGEVQKELNDETDYVVTGSAPMVISPGDATRNDSASQKQFQDAQADLRKYNSLIEKATEMHVPLVALNRREYSATTHNLNSESQRPSSRPATQPSSEALSERNA